MKTASVADLRNDFARITKWIQAGERITITRRGQPIAVLAPTQSDRRAFFAKPDMRARRAAIFGKRRQSAKEAAEILDLSRRERE